MTPDIISRLRSTPLYEGHGEASDLPEMAAEEIARLREALAEATIRAERSEKDAEFMRLGWTALCRKAGIYAARATTEESGR